MEEDHVHCMSCVNQRCMVRPQPGISCDLIACPLVCGAVFHSCKVDEHHLVCALVRVPCLNSGYGCPVALVRNQMYAHLEVCPAGVVCCTMEWNRWPVSCLDYTSYESLSRGVEEVEQLDMALALQDQRTLLESLKVIAMAPTAEGEPLVPASKENRATDSSLLTSAPEASIITESPSQASSSHQPQPPPQGSAKERIVSGINGLNEEHFSKLYEATVETARSLSAALDFVSSANPIDGSKKCIKNRLSNDGDLQNGPDGKTPEAADGLNKEETEEQSVCSSCLRGNGAVTGTDLKILKTTNGPLSGGMEACLETACPVEVKDDMNAGVSQEPALPQMTSPVHVSQGVAQRAAHVVLEDRGLVLLGNHGPERKFHNYNLFRGQGQCSLPNGRIGYIQDRSVFRLRPKMEDKAVDTSDLEQVDDPMGLGEIDLITAALLFCLEESRECRRISDTVYVDGHRVDFGTQTFTFPAAILLTNTRVGEIASASACDHAAPQLSYPSPFRTLRLGLVLEALKVEAVAQNRYLPPNPRYQHMFPFVCGQSLRRDQFSSHFTNVHGDIHAGLNGWMEHRCPLAYYGCTFSQRRFYPSTEGAKVVHDRHLRSFGVQPCPRAKFPSDFQSDQISGLPIEILWHIAGFLDSFSLCQLSLVSRTMREVCASLLQTRGIVELQWERRRRPGTPGHVSWQIKNRVWRFSTAFSPVLSWGFTDLPSMSDHLKKCHFNNVEHKTEPVPLPAMCTARDGHSLRRVLRHINT
ncbi:F-box only protein 30-like [Cyclopterus lumpus]|uniref:F-box only protein 30-like n=1 Tax=Cyclopterus lumpus TaxID=8103 RepID=UPI001486F73E|nr:F-box only protein 30-like [Cyclopterus lumpus]XP_034384323.1 F-box only protein 30-like [Cyclopterus lumpus]XP_034384324.1 F-box only protein 30-like [Cyclopterus lumpus]XP_034384325.1 F-box only protein 30-like [Cyclopterus lumpus]XP_034384326.1 F-box only protein 30-like [Cyclopterus lumpus]